MKEEIGQRVGLVLIGLVIGMAIQGFWFNGPKDVNKSADVVESILMDFDNNLHLIPHSMRSTVNANMSIRSMQRAYIKYLPSSRIALELLLVGICRGELE